MEKIPWIDVKIKNEIDFIIANGSRPFNIFEWGSGGSTLWFCEKRVGKVISIEHNQEWYDNVNAELILFNLDGQILFRPPRINPGLIHSLRMPNYDFSCYIDTLSNTNDKFDMIFIDGRARELCFCQAIQHIRHNGWVILHDFERNDYKSCKNIAETNGFSVSEIIESRNTLICHRI